ncbi:MAG TPA: class II fructose-bisphosphate aldolase [Microbacteriaceae bacterium]|nr:class II fructose-bisphosphate aldolase [Microbacteriaceae bacterium]
MTPNPGEAQGDLAVPAAATAGMGLPGEVGTRAEALPPRPVTELLRALAADRHGVGAFNVVLLEHAEAIVAGAAEAGLPTLLQISENCVRYHGALRPIVASCRELAASCPVPVFVHLDHITDRRLVEEGLAAGVDSVMFDGSKLPYDENVAATAAVVRACHARGVSVEAEIGEVGGKDGVHAPGVRTRPGEAAQFALATGVDALAVAVGTSHAMTSRTASVDHDLISRIAAAVAVPLVLHGSSGVPDGDLAKAVAAGMTKVNISTHLNKLFTGEIRRVLGPDPDVVDPRKYVAPARTVVAAEVARLLRLLA